MRNQMPLPVSASLSLPETVHYIAERSGATEDRVGTALVDAALMGTIAATGCLHLSYHPDPVRYFAHPALRARQIVPPEAWGLAISWDKSRVGRYDLVRFDRADIERWLASVATNQQSGAVAEVSESQVNASGIRTNRAAAAEVACGQWLSQLTARPTTKEAAFEAAKDAVASIGPLSRKAFDRAWAAAVPQAWKEAGRHR
jgi:hypothetical protein